MISLFLFKNRYESHRKTELTERYKTLQSRYDAMLIDLNKNPPKDFKAGYKRLLNIGSDLASVECQLNNIHQ